MREYLIDPPTPRCWACNCRLDEDDPSPSWYCPDCRDPETETEGDNQ